MNAIVTVTGRDTVGIIADMSKVCLEYNINIVDVTQKVFEGELFAMIMLLDFKNANAPFADVSKKLKDAGAARGLIVHAMQEDIFNSMHRI